MQKKHQYKNEGAEARERAHQFGQPGSNPQGNPGAAVDVRKFLRWAETEATEEELRAYAGGNEPNPRITETSNRANEPAGGQDSTGVIYDAGDFAE